MSLFLQERECLKYNVIPSVYYVFICFYLFIDYCTLTLLRDFHKIFTFVWLYTIRLNDSDPYTIFQGDLN